MTQPGFLRLSLIGLAVSLVGLTHAADGPRPAWTTSKLQGTPTPPAPYEIRPAFPNLKFALPTSLNEIPGAASSSSTATAPAAGTAMT